MISSFSNENIKNKIKHHLPINNDNKNKYAEVFTPYTQVVLMFDGMPKEVWSNPKLKFLDPANGIGNFPMVAYLYLMDGLKLWEPDTQNRSKHIIKNMLYMVELNPVNVEISRTIFGPEANIHCGSFLDDDCPFKTADIIMGNPPFNTERSGEKGTNAGRSIIWDKFIIKSMSILNENGYLTFINPANWRGLGPLNSIWKLLTKHQIHYIQINGSETGKEVFNVGSRFDNYLVQKKPYTEPTLIIDELGETHRLKIDKLPFLPNYALDLIFPLLTDEIHGIDVLYGTKHHTSKHLKNTSTDKIGYYKYPVIHSINKDGIVPLMWANDNTKGHFGVKKVILNFGRYQYSHPEQNDWEGKYGMSQISFGIPIKSKEEGDLILKAIDTNTFKTIIKATKWATFQTDYRMFKYFKNDFFIKLLE